MPANEGVQGRSPPRVVVPDQHGAGSTVWGYIAEGRGVGLSRKRHRDARCRPRESVDALSSAQQGDDPLQLSRTAGCASRLR
jgi:hypothetical protein